MRYECIVKTAKNREGEILWRAIYIDNKKEYENYNIDLQKALKYYAPNGLWKEEIILDDDIYNHLEDYFPDKEDFLFLMDCLEIEVGKVVYLENGENVVSDVWVDYRPSGEYYIWLWEEIDNKWVSAKIKQYFQGSDVIKFKVENSDIEYTWEDFSYHQSLLYLNYKQ